MGLISFFRLPPDPQVQQENRFYRFFGLGGGVIFDNNRTASSPYVPPLYLGIIRLLLGLYGCIAFVVYFFILISQDHKFLRRQAWKLLGDIMFLIYLGQTGYFIFAGCHSILFATERKNPLAIWPRPCQLAHILLQTTVMCMPLFCSVIYLYWSLPALPIWHAHRLSRWSVVTFYILNTVFSLMELVLSSSRPRPWSHLIIVILLLGLYLAFHSTLAAASRGRVWVYTVLKYSLAVNRGWISVVRVVGLCVLACINFCIMQLLLWIKCRYLEGLKLPQVTQPVPRSRETVFKGISNECQEANG